MKARHRLSVHRLLVALLLTLTLALVFGVLFASAAGMVDAQSVPLVSTPTWGAFQPQGWVTHTAVAASVVVSPEQAMTPSARFRVRESTSAAWSPWVGVESIDVIANGYRLTTPEVGFSEGDANQVQFRLTVDQVNFESDPYPVRVDRTPPAVALTAPPIGFPGGFMVSWNGQDAGSGLASTSAFNVFYRKNDDTDWSAWLTDLASTVTSDIFGPEQPTSLQVGDRIGLRVSARDQAGLVGSSSIMTTTVHHHSFLPIALRWLPPPPAWTRAGPQLSDKRIRDLTTDPNSSMSLYAATRDNGAYRNTVCNNPSWESIGPVGRFTLSVLIDGDVTLVGTFGNSVNRREGAGLWASVNVGNPYVWTLANDSGGAIYAGTDAGVFRSQNRGQSWDEWRNGLSGPGLLINDLWVDSDTIWAATFGGGVYRRPVAGTTDWSVVEGLSGDALRSWSLAKDGDDMLVGTEAGVFRLSNGTWTSFGLPNQYVYALAVGSNGVRYAGTRSSGVYVRPGSATTWSAINNGVGWPADMLVYDLLISTPCNVIFAATRDGVWQRPLQ